MRHEITINLKIFGKFKLNRRFSEKRKGEFGERNQRKEWKLEQKGMIKNKQDMIDRKTDKIID